MRISAHPDGRGKCGTKHSVASLEQVRQLHLETNEIVVGAGLGIEDSGMQLGGPTAMGLFVGPTAARP